MTSLGRLTMRQIEELPPETLALELLQRFPEWNAVRRSSVMVELLMAAREPRARQVGMTREYPMQDNPQATVALAEAWQRLVLDALIVNWPPSDPQYQSE